VIDVRTGALIVNNVVPAGPEGGVAVMVTIPIVPAVATFNLNVAAPEGSGVAVQVTEFVKSEVVPSV